MSIYTTLHATLGRQQTCQTHHLPLLTPAHWSSNPTLFRTRHARLVSPLSSLLIPSLILHQHLPVTPLRLGSHRMVLNTLFALLQKRNLERNPTARSQSLGAQSSKDSSQRAGSRVRVLPQFRIRLTCSLRGKRYLRFPEVFAPTDMYHQNPNSSEGRNIA